MLCQSVQGFISPISSVFEATVGNRALQCLNDRMPQPSTNQDQDSTKTFLGLKPSGNKTPEQKRLIREIRLASCPVHTLPVAGGKPWGSLVTGYDDKGQRISLFEKQAASSA